MSFSHRIATLDDAPAIESLMALSMSVLLKDVLSPEQVAKSNESMGLDTQIIKDGTYFLILDDAQLVGCGGWSRRRTLYGGNHTLGSCLLYTSPSPRDLSTSRMPSSA